MNYYIIVFKNTLDAMTAEKELKKLGREFKMMPTPTSITQSCGLCVRIEEEKNIRDIINEGIIRYKDVYVKSIDGYSKLV